MPVSFDESVTNAENLAPEENDGKRKFQAHPTPHPKKKGRSIDEDDDDGNNTLSVHLGDSPPSAMLFEDIPAAGDGEEAGAIEKLQVTTKTNDRYVRCMQ
jgi:hypothetical protein